jgi:hypothetical protein
MKQLPRVAQIQIFIFDYIYFHCVNIFNKSFKIETDYTLGACLNPIQIELRSKLYFSSDRFNVVNVTDKNGNSCSIVLTKCMQIEISLTTTH